MKKEHHPTFADSICEFRARKIKKTFFNQINTLMDWSEIDKIIDKHYKKGNTAVGKPSYSGLLLFKDVFTTNLVRFE